jgi:meso-butanediol dehydrogenase/(S,S)-butanediol dehydrogenase/diacetyl reductase
MAQLADKVALVTGAGRGIGRGVAELFASEGATVIAVARTEAHLADLAATMADAPGQIIVMAGDLTDEAFVNSLFDEVKQRFKRLDILVNNAGIAPFGGVETLAVEDVRRCMELNVVAAFNCMSQAVQLMKTTGDVGKIINIGSVRSHWTEFGDGGAYNASKAGIRHMTESIARQLHGSSSQIAVSTVCPGVVDTPLTNPERKDATGWLKVEHIARSVLHVATAPADVNVFDVVVIPMAQAPW